MRNSIFVMCMVLCACNSNCQPNEPAAQVPVPSGCPSELNENQCRRYGYFVAATDAAFQGMPTDAEGRRKAVSALDPAGCAAASERLRQWGAKHIADRKVIDLSARLSPEEQRILRYGPNSEKPRTDIDDRLNAMYDARQSCVPLISAEREVGIDSDTGWQDGILDMTDYKSPN